MGYWLLVIGYWLLVIGYWLLIIMKNTATSKLEAIFCRETAMLCPYLKTAVTVNSQQSTVNHYLIDCRTFYKI
ncbi:MULTISPECIES: hypothetical protein [Microcoleaceae]|uniref:hypothetical protein n=1 Tax=Microcoleaceae TaxID=1892252 RepID=UPI002237233E|nr:hypothetical protein [Lyngbya sp. CCAP 1446/10]